MALPGLANSTVTEWFSRTYGKPTPVQAQAWPTIAQGKNALLVSPTGTGKTLAAFLAALHELAAMELRGELENRIYLLYISPLRALGYDLEKNLNAPLQAIYGEKPPIRVGLRSGDTSSAERQKQFTKPPHILLTTPESLCLLMSQEKWLPVLSGVRWVIVDEIHALAENKRGAHLSLSLERVDELVRSSKKTEPETPNQKLETNCVQRIGLSATVAPLDEVAKFLVGTHGQCEIIDASAEKKIDLRVYTPLGKNPYPVAGYTGERLIKELGRLVLGNRTTLIFTNTRSGAESATFWLKDALPELAEQIECHHASLDRDVRQEVEDRLKRGELRAVVCSTSLELGIDIGSIDLVVMLATPKGVSKALQRTGRAGHNIHSISRGLLMATNINDLIECCATALLARTRHLDNVRLPNAPLDVLAQHLVSMGCLEKRSRAEAFALVRKAHIYRHLTEQDFDDVLDYLAGGGKSLRKQYAELFGKIHLDEESFETRLGTVRRDFLQNVGVIPSEGTVTIRLKNRVLGSVEESFMRQLKPGDVFMIGGRAVQLEKVGWMEVFVRRADHSKPTIPRWNANKMPLSNRVAQEIMGFRSELRTRLEADDGPDLEPWIAARLDCGSNNARIIGKMYRAQHELSEIPTVDFLLVEELAASRDEETVAVVEPNSRKPRVKGRPIWVPARHYFIHSLIGRSANDALSRVVAQRLSRLRGGNAVATPDDYGFVLTVTPEQHFTLEELPQLLALEGFEEDLDQSLKRSALLQYHFRNAAQTGLMVYRNYFGEQKSVRKLHFSAEVIFNVLQEYEPDHVLMREARSDVLHTFLDVAGAKAFLDRAAELPKRLHAVDRVPPLSFAMYATKIKEALLVEDPAATMERLYNLWWSRIEGDEGKTNP
ncbi:MAG: helicase [Verrucomicrobia bacterium]|jgi:ATP-dependent Lhr-like helicase|nr:helicase [Verrucomicrobiota bacterium]